MSVINFEKKVIFIHIPRTAGISIESVLGGFGHYSLDEMEEMVTKYTKGIDLKEYFKFTIVRNPLDRLVSAYTLQSDDMGGFNNWIYRHESSFPFRTQKSFVCDEAGNLKVDFVGRFENLEEDWGKICEHIGEYELPHVREGKTTPQKPYSQYYTKETEKLVREWFKEDFKLFGYK